MPISRPRRTLSTSITVGERSPKITVSTGTLIRSMYQTASGTTSATALSYEFHFGISTFTHDGAGVLYTEIPRPLNLPLVDATSQKLERCSFEFLIAIPYDGGASSVDSHITLLQDFATEARPVNFLNVHSALALKTWNIDSMSFQVTRVNESGQATAATCNISLVEHIARTNERFYKLPKFTYAIPKGTGLAGTGGVGNENSGNGVTSGIIHMSALSSGLVTATTSTNHGLKSGQYVIISMEGALLVAAGISNVIGLAEMSTPYQISVNAALPTKFTYIKTGVTFISTAVPANSVKYTVTEKVVKTEVLVPVVLTPPDFKPYVPQLTPVAVDKDTKYLGAIPTGSNALIEEAITKYLFDLKIANPEMYNRDIGSTSSAAYKKARSYLLKIYNQGTAIYMVDLKEIIQNLG